MDKLLTKVNNEINKLEYKSDASNWGEKDYWATPTEMLEEGGDCEDFAIFKYFKLKELGFRVENLKITAVTLPDGQAHMVLIVYDNRFEAATNTKPMVLDNMIKEVMPISDRNDLNILYSFNENGVYVKNKLIGEITQIGKWQSLLEQIEDEEEDAETGDDYEDFERLS